MATSPTPSLESLPGANSIGSFGEHNDYLSDSPLTLSGSSPPVSDSAICDDFSGATSSLESHHQTNSSASSSSASSTSSSGIGGGGGGSGSGGGPGGGIITTSTGTRCTGCKSKQSDAVAKCIDCVNYLCSNCVTAHQFMHCFDGHSVFRINAFDNTITSPLNGSNCLGDMQTNPISFLMQPQTPQPQSQLSKLMMNGFDSQSQQSRFSLKDDPISKLSISSLLNGATSSNGSNDILAVASAVTTTASTNNSTSAGNKQTSQYFCTRHKNELLKFFCRTCTVPVCKDCIVMDHPAGLHECEHVQDATPKQIDSLLQIIAEVRSKAADMRQLIKNSEHNSARLQVQYHKAQNEINETYQFFRSMLDERKQELFKELENFFNAKTMSHSVLMAKTQEHVEKVLQSCDCVERVSKHAGLTDALMLRKLMETRLQSFVQYGQELQSTCELDFVSNYQAIQVGVRNTFGYIRSSADTPTAKQPPIARPTSNNMLGSGSNSNGGSNGSLNGPLSVGSGLLGNGSNPCPSSVLDRPFASVTTNGTNSVLGNQQNSFDSNIISKRFNSVNSLGPFVSDVNLQVNPYEKWSNGGSDNVFNGLSDQYALPIGTSSGVGVNSNVSSTTGQGDSMIDITSKLLSTTIFPPKSQIKRQKMIYHCKFGEFGVMEGQFTEPSGVAVNAQNDIIVADTNNHRIQIFDKEGRFKFQFGECGKRDGQLLYPNRVAVVRNSGDIIVTERSPTHQIQIYNQYGQFVRKFGANILQHPRGVTVDNKGRIIVVECKVMRVIIFDQSGNVLQKFGCSKHLEFPNGVVVNDKQEIFISDNRAHCVKVFNYEGTYLRQIGGEGITNYPIGVGINAAGEILIADNHNNFNLTIFTQDGQLVSALESKVKHAQCFDVALMDDGSVVLASKDYRLYIYRYVQEKQKCSLEEFAIFFLNFIRAQTDGFLRGSTASTSGTPRRNSHLASGKNSTALDTSFAEVSETSFPSLPNTPQQQPQHPKQEEVLPEKNATKSKKKVQTTFTPLRSDNGRKSIGDEPQLQQTPFSKKENRISGSPSTSCSITELEGESSPFVTPIKNRSLETRFSSNTSTPVAKWPDRLNYSLTPSKPSSPGAPPGSGGKSKNSKDKGKSPASICLGDFIVATASHKKRSAIHSSQPDSGAKSSKSQEVKKSIRRVVPTPAPAPHDEDRFVEVTSKEVLDRFVQIHSALIDLNLTTNILTEVSYLLNLLNIEEELFGRCSDALKGQNVQIDSKLINIASREYCRVLKRPPNCIYFALRVLEKQKYLLALLDVTTLRVVLDNNRLERHCKELKEFLGGIYSYKVQLEGVKSNHEASFRIGQSFTNVFYQEENDTRNHFPSDREFGAFRKQRDMFYTILKAWETRHLKPTFNFAAELGAKVNSIFTTMDHPINMAHLSKLFTSQLIISSNFSETPSELEIASLNIDKDKLAKLRQRLVAPSDFSTDYQFPGKQAFFKDFLLVAQSMSFFEQMKLALIAELMERNGSFYEIISLSFTMDDKKLYNEYVVRPEIIATMRVLGKFLGLLMARPYMYEGPRSAEVDNKQIELRNMMRPAFDVMEILKKSLSERKLLVTIPWLVQYVSMLDRVTLCLSYYRELINILYEIYLNLNKKNACSQFQMRPTSVFILRCCLGWLFDRPHVFDDFYTYRQNRETASDSLTDGIRELSRILQKSSDGIKVEEKTVTKEILLNASEAASEAEQPIDVAILKTSFDPLLESVLNVACPFLADFRVAIMPSKLAKSTSRDGSCRKVTTKVFDATTPVRSVDDDPQAKLTEAFLHSQTMSVRRIVEFVTERTTSAVVKDFQVEVLLPMRDKSLQRINVKDESGKVLERLDAITEAHAQTMQKWNEELEGKIENRVKMALEALLPHETPEAVKSTCALIVIKKCKVKAEEWRIANLSGLEFFSKDVSKAVNETTVLKIYDLKKALPSEIFHRLHYLLYISYAKPALVNQSNIFQFCSDCIECVHVQKLPASALKLAANMLVCLTQNLIKCNPVVFSDELVKKFIQIWLCDEMKEFVGILEEQDDDDDSPSDEKIDGIKEIKEDGNKEEKEDGKGNGNKEEKEQNNEGKEEKEENKKGKEEQEENKEGKVDNNEDGNKARKKESKEDGNNERSPTYSIFDELAEEPFIRSLGANAQSYDRLTHLLICLISSGLLTINYLNKKFVALFKQEWPEDIFKQISLVLESIGKQTVQQLDDEEKSHLFMEMLADLARHMEDF